jgi:SAM-dependent methyltransferase
MTISIINPKNKAILHSNGDSLVDSQGNIFPIIHGVARISEIENYTKSFGWQWNIFDKIQLDREYDGQEISKKRFFAETGWNVSNLAEKNILEVGSGAGRFSKVILEYTQANLYSIDYSDAVTANYKNNSSIAPDRFHLFQASIYEMPFHDNAFDKVFCFGVLQHTPDFNASVEALIKKVKPGGEVIVDFYPIKGWWTKIHAKYMLRPLTKKISHENLFRMIDGNIDWLIKLSNFLTNIGLGLLTRFLPIVDLRTIPTEGINKTEYREWIVLDTFDMFSPEYDHPQTIKNVVKMFLHNGVEVTFADFVEYSCGSHAAVVRGVKPA